jgi:tetratricopeptide (TPR) repeat protein
MVPKWARDQPEAKPDSDERQRYVGNGYWRIGKFLANREDRRYEAYEEHNRALEIRKDLVGKQLSNRVYQINLSQSYSSIGKLYKCEGNLEEASTQYQAALQIMDDLTNYGLDNAVWKNRRARLKATIADLHAQALVEQHQFDDGCEGYPE